MSNADVRDIDAVIAVRRDGSRTWYARRSHEMSTYKGVWSLPSIKFDPAATTDPTDVSVTQPLLDRLSTDRLGGVPMRAVRHLVSGSSADNPMGVRVTLHLFEVDMSEDPVLNHRYYLEDAWMTAGELQEAMRGTVGGLCTKLWGRHAWGRGLSDRPYRELSE
jgi:hypothetical protein